MTTTGKQLLIGLILIYCIFLMTLAQSEDLALEPDRLVVEEISANGISWKILTEMASIKLKVASKAGIVFERRFEPSEPLWYDLTRQDGSFLEDGSYRYELLLSRKLNSDEERLLWEAEESGIKPAVEMTPVAFRSGGDFQVNGGAIDTSFQEGSPEPDLPLPGIGSSGAVPMDDISGDLYVAGGLCTGECTEAFAGNLPNEEVRIWASSPRLCLDSVGGGDWWFRSSSSGDRLEITDTGGIFSHIKFTMLRGSPDNSFFMDAEGKLGLGTSIPEQELHITGKDTSGDPTIRFEATGAAEDQYEWEITGNEHSFYIKDVTEGRTPFWIEVDAPTGSISVESSGDVGLGVKTPESPLHVKRSDGMARILVEETSAVTAVRTQFQLQNNGAPRFALENTSSGIEWSFQQSGPGNFLISKEGTGGPEMQVYQNGRVRMGPAGAINFDLAPNGDLAIAGSLTANGSVFPDYVFEADYALMPLSELGAFIEEEKRLPRIPSAEEIQKKGGHNMTELQLRLLEKIEELTLYTLQQDQRLREKETELLKQSERIGVLETQLLEIRSLLGQ